MPFKDSTTYWGGGSEEDGETNGITNNANNKQPRDADEECLKKSLTSCIAAIALILASRAADLSSRCLPTVSDGAADFSSGGFPTGTVGGGISTFLLASRAAHLSSGGFPTGSDRAADFSSGGLPTGAVGEFILTFDQGACIYHGWISSLPEAIMVL